MFAFAAWTLLLAIVVFTLSPIGLRPETGASPRLERFVAFCVLSAAFTLAYPRHFVRVLMLVAIAAVGLELCNSSYRRATRGSATCWSNCSAARWGAKRQEL